MKNLKLTPSLESIEQVTSFVEQELETAVRHFHGEEIHGYCGI